MSLPPPTTVSTRSLRPRKSKGKAPATSQPCSVSGSSRSGSVSISKSPQRDELIDADNAYGSLVRGRGTHIALKREHSVSPVAGPSRTKKRRSAVSGSPTSAIDRAQVMTPGPAYTRSLGFESTEPAITTSEPPLSGVSVAHEYEHVTDQIGSSFSGGRDVATDSVPDDSDTQGAAICGTALVDETLAPSAGTPTPPPENLTVLSRPDGEPDYVLLSADVSARSQAASSGCTSGARSSPQPTRPLEAVPIDEVEPLAAYTCPVCFSPPSFATITPCGHVLCGECLFTAVKTTLQRGAYTLPPGERMLARCPMCRAPIPGWDGKGGGVIGLRPRAVFSL